MPRVIEGSLLVAPGHVAIVVSRFNELITERLLAGAVETFRRHGLSDEYVTVVKVSGSFEIPLVAKALAETRRYAGIVCLGAVIQGETSHHEYINHQVAAGILNASLAAGVPIAFGILTCPTMDHALDRAGGKAGNKGVEATLAVIEQMNVLQQIWAGK